MPSAPDEEDNWKFCSGPKVQTFKGAQFYYVKSVVYSPEGRRIASGSDDKTIRTCQWDAETGALVVGPLLGHGDHATSVVYSLDGQRITSSSTDYTIRVWAVSNPLMQAHMASSIQDSPLACDPDQVQPLGGPMDSDMIPDLKTDGC